MCNGVLTFNFQTMKNYSEIYVSLREEIMQAIDEKVNSLLAKYDVDNLSDLENAPILRGWITEYIDGSNPVLVNITLLDIFVGGECNGFPTEDDSIEPQCYGLCEFETDSLIEIYEKLCEYGN